MLRPTAITRTSVRLSFGKFVPYSAYCISDKGSEVVMAINSMADQRLVAAFLNIDPALWNF